MNLIAYVSLGALVGLLDRILANSKEPRAWGPALLMGVLGALLGSFLGRLLFTAQGDVPSFALALFGAVALVLLCRVKSDKRAGGFRPKPQD